MEITMQLKYSIQQEIQQIDFSINPETGALIIETNGRPVEVPHTVAVELISTLSRKLYDHSEKSETLLNRLFR